MKHIGLFKILCIAFSILFSPAILKADSFPGTKKGINIILFIGDGMSLAQWQTGMIMSHTPLHIKRMSSIGIIQTNALTDFVGDGPSHGTAIATGVKTDKGAVAMDNNDKPLKSIIEYAKEKGIASGIVSANTLMEGSIAPFIAHTKNRMQREEIALAYLQQKPYVFIGGGISYFSNRKDKRNLLKELEAKNYRIAKSIPEIQNTKSGRLAGFLPDTVIADSLNRGNTLATSVYSALNILEQQKKNFFLLVGDMFIDRASHAGNTKLVGLETINFDKAIGVALDFAEKNKNTVVLVVGGPEASGMTLTDGDMQKQEVTAKWTMPGMIHTGTMIPVFSYGTGAENFQGILENTELFFKIKKLLLNE